MASQITALPTAPSRATPSTFSTLADAWVAALATFVTQANVLATEAEADSANATTQAATATTQASIATLAANYKGLWSAQTGPAAVPYVVYHLSKYWTLLSNLADVTAKTPGTDSEWAEIVIYTGITVTSKTADYTLSASDLSGNMVFNNTGATGQVKFTLPAGAANNRVSFRVTAAQYLKVQANGTEVFRFGSSVGSAGGYIRDNAIATCFTIEWSGTQWLITSIVGTLKADE